jgi:intracellular septation protein
LVWRQQRRSDLLRHAGIDGGYRGTNGPPVLDRQKTQHAAKNYLGHDFGGTTLALHDKRFIMWKPTVLYAGMSIALAIAVWGMKHNFLKAMLGSQLELPDRVWHKLNIAWIGYTAFMAVSNAYVATYYSEDAWANFKIWGYAFPIVFLICQGLYISPHIKADVEGEEAPSDQAKP